MRFGKKTPEQVEKEIEGVKLEDELLSHEVSVAEKEAVIKQLKEQYGSSWMKTLGVNKLTDLSTLKSFLSGAKKGMQKSGTPVYNPMLSPLMPGRRNDGEGRPF